jgi:hypothetical protein
MFVFKQLLTILKRFVPLEINFKIENFTNERDETLVVLFLIITAKNLVLLLFV